MTAVDPDRYCREIEAYLCRKNAGHLVRIVGPQFEMVRGWAAEGVPLKVAFRGIDRYVERYQAKATRQRPVRIEFCEGDVLATFDEWRRAVLPVRAQGTRLRSDASAAQAGHPPSPGGSVGADAAQDDDNEPERRRSSLPAHLDRIQLQLTNAHVSGGLPATLDEAVERTLGAVDNVRREGRGARGDARRALIARLRDADEVLMRAAIAACETEVLESLRRDADDQLDAFRARLTADAYAEAREAAVNRLVRERFALPVVMFD